MCIYMNRSRNGITLKFLPFIYITFVLGAQKNRLSRQAQGDGVFQLFWVLKSTVSLRRLFLEPTTYALVDK